MILKAPSMIVITGIMASGKSTVAQLLSEQLNPSVHLRGDIFRKMIVNNRQEVQPDASEDELDQLRLRYQLTVQAAEMYHQAGFNVVVQDVIVGPMLTEFIASLHRRPLYLVVLSPSTAAVAAREAARSKTGYGIWTVEGLDHLLQQETARIGMWLDSTELSPEETVLEIVARLNDEAMIT